MGLGAYRYFVMSSMYRTWTDSQGRPTSAEIIRLCRFIKGERKPGNYSAETMQESAVLVQEYLQEAWTVWNTMSDEEKRDLCTNFWTVPRTRADIEAVPEVLAWVQEYINNLRNEYTESPENMFAAMSLDP